MPLETVRGGCLCGEVNFSITADMKHFFQCHCIQCRKTTASSYAANIIADPAPIEWLSGEDNISRFDYPGRAFTQVFCSTCGSGLPFLDRSGEMLFIPAGTLDSTPAIQPEANIFWEERAPWHDSGLEAPSQVGCDEF